MASVKTKTQAKRPHLACDSDNDEPSPRFIILESKEKLPLAKISPFIIEKMYLCSNLSQNRKKLAKWNHPYRGDRKKTSRNNIKAKKILNIDIKALPP